MSQPEELIKSKEIIESKIKKLVDDIYNYLLKINNNIFDNIFDNITNEHLIQLKNNNYYIEHAPDIIKNNYNIILELVNKNGLFLKYASDNLKDNYKIVLNAVKQNESAFKYASEIPYFFDISGIVITFVFKVNPYDRIYPLGFRLLHYHRQGHYNETANRFRNMLMIF